jgi:hypothetical protein
MPDEHDYRRDPAVEDGCLVCPMPRYSRFHPAEGPPPPRPVRKPRRRAARPAPGDPPRKGTGKYHVLSNLFRTGGSTVEQLDDDLARQCLGDVRSLERAGWVAVARDAAGNPVTWPSARDNVPPGEVYVITQQTIDRFELATLGTLR